MAIRATTGQRVDVKHRDYMFVPPNSLKVVVADDQNGFRTIDTALVTEIRWKIGARSQQQADQANLASLYPSARDMEKP